MSRRLLRDPQRLRAAFLIVMLVFTATLAWLAWTVVEQDRERHATRVIEERELAADLIVASLERRLSAWLQQLDRWSAPTNRGDVPVPPTGTIVVRFDRDGITAWPTGGLIYDPAISTPPVADVEATILIEQAGLYSSQRRFTEALATYSRLEARGSVVVAGMPAPIAARLGRLRLHQRAGNSAAVLNEARLLASDLASGRWPVSYAAYKNLSGVVRHHLPTAEGSPPRAEVLADAVTWLWDAWSQERLNARWISQRTAEGPVVLMWRTAGASLVAIAAGPSFLERELVSDVAAIASEKHVRLSLVSPDDGRPMLDEQHDPTTRSSLRMAGHTGLPWTLRVSSVAANDPALAARRSKLLAGLGVIAAFVLTGAWFVGRAVARELELARLKSDFVAAVSHEFRTPLTMLVQLSELLQQGRIATDADRQAYYDVISAESHRLRRLVERLLSFGRVESGRSPYQLVPLDVKPTVTACVEEFRARQDLRQHRFEIETSDGEIPRIRGDAEALSTVVWNLLENAAKYSPEGGLIRVDLSGVADHVMISVRDQGIGIPTAEQARIFEPFVRGTAARDRQIRGTGIGLALARTIVHAHGGDIGVQSEAGKGSTFRVRLPREKPWTES